MVSTRVKHMKKDKKYVERLICKEFCSNKNVIPQTHDSYTLEKEQESPDFLLKDNKGNIIGLEITSAHYGQDWAKGEGDIARLVENGEEGIFDCRGKPINGSLPLSAGISNPDGHLASFVQNVIKEKCTHRYGMPAILIVHLHAPLGTERTVTEIRKTVSIPQGNLFSEIYICFEVPSSTLFFNEHYNGKLTFFRIYPTTDKLYNLDEQKLSIQKARYESEHEEKIKQLIKMPEEEFNKLCESVQIWW